MEAVKASFFWLAGFLRNQSLFESIPTFLANPIKAMQDVGHLGGMNPVNCSVIDVCDLKQ